MPYARDRYSQRGEGTATNGSVSDRRAQHHSMPVSLRHGWGWSTLQKRPMPWARCLVCASSIGEGRRDVHRPLLIRAATPPRGRVAMVAGAVRRLQCTSSTGEWGTSLDNDSKDRDHRKEADPRSSGHHFTSPTADALDPTDNSHAGDGGRDCTDDELRSVDG